MSNACVKRIENIYDKNLVLAKEDSGEGENPRDIHLMAVKWTVEECSALIRNTLSQTWEQREELKNKSFYG